MIQINWRTNLLSITLYMFIIAYRLMILTKAGICDRIKHAIKLEGSCRNERA